MRNFLNIIALLFATVALVCAAGCAEKTQTVGNKTPGVSEQVTPTIATPNITAKTSVAISVASVTPTSSVTPAPSVTKANASMKGMGSTSSTGLDPALKVVDVVCKMEIDKRTTEFTSEYKGTTYYFCALSCNLLSAGDLILPKYFY